MYTEQKIYSTQGANLNVPVDWLLDAGLPLGSKLSVLIADGMLILAAAEAEHQRDLTDELSCVMEELGHDPEIIFTVSDGSDEYDSEAGDDDDDK